MNVFDIFSGLGGFSLGLERAGFKTVAFCEKDEFCRKVLKKHWPNVPIAEDVRRVRLNDGALWYDDECPEYSGGFTSPYDEIDVICGGFPCQNISVAGKKEGIHGKESGLWKEFKRLIKEIKPRYAIIENVANLRANGLKEVISDLWSIGYDCEWHIISARSLGAPHLRERIWIIAYPKGEGLERLSPQRVQAKNTFPGGPPYIPPNSHHFRLWQPFASEEEKSKWWAKTTAGFRDWWQTEPRICRVSDGLPKGLERDRKARIKALGNSLVPQIPELIGREILKYERRMKEIEK